MSSLSLPVSKNLLDNLHEGNKTSFTKFPILDDDTYFEDDQGGWSGEYLFDRGNGRVSYSRIGRAAADTRVHCS